MSTPHKWEISVFSGGYYPAMTSSFLGNDISLCYEHDEHTGHVFFAFSHHIDGLSDHQAISNRLATLQVLLNGILRFTSGRPDFFPTIFDGYAECDELGGYRDITPDRLEEYPFDRTIDIDTLRPLYKKGAVDLDSYLLGLCKSDECLLFLFILIGLIKLGTFEAHILTWNNLYKLVDSVKHYAASHKWKISEFVDEKQLKGFTAACNNVGVIGIHARHGQMGWSKPPFTLDLEHSINLIFSMTRSFIKKYLHEVYKVQFSK